MTKRHRILFSGPGQVAIDLTVFIFSWLSAYVARFEGLPEGSYLHQMIWLLPFVIVARTLLFYGFSVYTIVWRYFSIRDALRLLRAAAPISVLFAAFRFAAPAGAGFIKVPVGVIVVEFLAVMLCASGVRALRRLTAEGQDREIRNGTDGHAPRTTLLVGAGDAGNLILRELQSRTDLGAKAVGFVDDDPDKYGKTIQGVRVLGNTTQIPDLVRRLGVEEIIISIANASSRDIRRIVELSHDAGVKVRIVPGLFELLEDNVKISKVREIQIDDLLGRDVVNFEARLPEIENFYRDKRILITGAGGSIGSELCRQLCHLWPKELVLLDKDENSIYEIDTELRYKHPESRPIPVIANIKNRQRLDHIFSTWRPEVVFHAAAHKHVPLMELNAPEAVLNNIGGTQNVLEASDKFGVERFIFISSDKAVNPTNIMGATKKVGELLVQDLAARSRTRFACVRFGNVIGSRGSVIPLFQRQIAAGGPVTVTHPDMERYFMSISEAVQLIIQAGTLGEKGEIFVLDMGKQVKIRDLARDLIRLSGYKEDEIEIKYTGLRPGEKLFEEILIDKEKDCITSFEKIFIAQPDGLDASRLNGNFVRLVDAAAEGDTTKIRSRFREMGIGFTGVGR